MINYSPKKKPRANYSNEPNKLENIVEYLNDWATCCVHEQLTHLLSSVSPKKNENKNDYFYSKIIRTVTRSNSHT